MDLSISAGSQLTGRRRLGTDGTGVPRAAKRIRAHSWTGVASVFGPITATDVRAGFRDWTCQHASATSWYRRLPPTPMGIGRLAPLLPCNVTAASGSQCRRGPPTFRAIVQCPLSVRRSGGRCPALRRSADGCAKARTSDAGLPEHSYVDAPRWASKILSRVGGSLVRYSRMSGLLMRHLLAAGPYGVREIGSKSAWRALRPSECYWFFRPRLADCLPIPRSFVLLPTSPGSYSFFLIPSFLAPAQAAA